ncbi:MAG: allantoicase [Terriglobales bacterium]
MNDFTQSVDLASERVGGRVLAANDEFFAPRENLLKPAKPLWIEDKYTDHGKWMDGWETRRRRTPGFDWCTVQLGIPGILRGVVVDTSYFKGNYPEQCSIEACALADGARVEEVSSDTIRWAEVLPKSALKGDTQNCFEIGDPHRYTHLRFNIYPDGGVARLRVHGEALPDWKRVLAEGACIDLAAIANGGRVLDSSDMFFSAPQNLLMPAKSTHMGDGWETRRRRGPGHDWVIIRLGIAGIVRQIEVDTSHFKGNFPESCSLEVCDGSASPHGWKEVLPRTLLQADSVHRFEITDGASASQVRFNIYPDGGVARLRIYGVPTREGRIAESLRGLNALPDEAARAALLSCCGSSAWAEHVRARRPFHDAAQLLDAAREAWEKLGKNDWLEAFSHHPKIGERKAAGEPREQARQWSEQEQRSVANAAPHLLDELANANQRYQARFGYIFIVCASGKSTEEMLGLLGERMKNDPETELGVAAGEQQKITRLRLEKMLEL